MLESNHEETVGKFKLKNILLSNCQSLKKCQCNERQWKSEKVTKETGHVKAVREAVVDLGSGKNIIKNITKVIGKNLHLDCVFNNSIV